ncbi:MAG: DUF6531 domain-containing protein, partial [Acidobacteriota bacterium]
MHLVRYVVLSVLTLLAAGAVVFLSSGRVSAGGETFQVLPPGGGGQGGGGGQDPPPGPPPDPGPGGGNQPPGGQGGGSGDSGGEDGSLPPKDIETPPQSPAEGAGDPVNLPSGAFLNCRTDLMVPGRGLDFQWRRCYRYQSYGLKTTVLGRDWHLNYDQRVITVKSNSGSWDAELPVLWENGNGGEVEFTPHASSTLPAGRHEWVDLKTGAILQGNVTGAGIYMTLTNAEIRTPGGLTLSFMGAGTNFPNRLASLSDRAGNSIQITWGWDPTRTDVVIVQVTDTLGRLYTPTYKTVPPGRVVLDSISDFAGRRVDYAYVASATSAVGAVGDLRAVFLPEISGTSTGNDFDKAHFNRKVIRYSYAGGLVKMEDPEGPYLLNWYGPGTVLPSSSPFAVSNPYRVVAQVQGETGIVPDPSDPAYPPTFCADPAHMDPSVPSPKDVTCFQYEQIPVHKICDNWQEQMYSSRLACKNNADFIGQEVNPGTLKFRTMLARVVTVRVKDRAGNVLVHRYSLEESNHPLRTHVITAAADAALITAPYDPWNPGVDPLTGAPGVRTTEYTYNGLDLLTRSVSPTGQVREIVYNTSHPDPLFWSAPLKVLKDGELVEENEYADLRFPLPTAMRVPRPGIPATQADPSLPPPLVETTLSYDGAGRLLSRTFPDRTLPDGTVLTRQETFSYNAFGQLVRSVDAEGNVTLRDYDPACSPDGANPGCGAGGGGYLRSVMSDAEDNPGRNQDMDGVPSPGAVQAVTRFTYDALGHRVTTTGPGGLVTFREINQQGQVVAETVDPGGLDLTRRFFYNGNGMLVRADTEDRFEGISRWVSRLMTYDSLNTPRSVTTGAVLAAANDPSVAAPESGVTVQMLYDGERRVVGEVMPEGEAVRKVLDEAGRPVSVTRGCSFDGATVVCGSGSSTSTMLYDDEGRLVESRTALGRTTRMEYDSRGDLVRVLKPDLSGMEFERDLSGRVLVERDYDKGSGTLLATGGISFTGLPLVRTEMDYDERGDLIRSRLLDPADPVAPLSESLIFRDRLGRVVKAVDGGGALALMRYDGMGRVVWEQGPSGDEMERVFDPAGLVLSETVREFPQSSDLSSPPVNLALPVVRTTLFEYDLAGRLLKTTDAAGGVVTRVYDSRGILRRQVDELGNVTQMETDAQGRVVRQVQEKRTGGVGSGALEQEIETRFAYDGDSRLVQQWDDLGRLTAFTYDLQGRQVRRTFAGLA